MGSALARLSTMEPLNLDQLSASLFESARESRAERAAHTVHAGVLLRQTALALLAGAELSEHDSPPEATLQVLNGRIWLQSQGRHWEVGAGELVPIPDERHAVAALEDSVFLLTVWRDRPESSD